jgi:hypothetical protein
VIPSGSRANCRRLWKSCENSPLSHKSAWTMLLVKLIPLQCRLPRPSKLWRCQNQPRGEEKGNEHTFAIVTGPLAELSMSFRAAPPARVAFGFAVAKPPTKESRPDGGRLHNVRLEFVLLDQQEAMKHSG